MTKILWEQWLGKSGARFLAVSFPHLGQDNCLSDRTTLLCLPAVSAKSTCIQNNRKLKEAYFHYCLKKKKKKSFILPQIILSLKRILTHFSNRFSLLEAYYLAPPDRSTSDLVEPALWVKYTIFNIQFKITLLLDYHQKTINYSQRLNTC